MPKWQWATKSLTDLSAKMFVVCSWSLMPIDIYMYPCGDEVKGKKNYFNSI